MDQGATSSNKRFRDIFSASRLKEKFLGSAGREDYPYQYRPLEYPDSIRVLLLHYTQSRLECTIVHVKVSEGLYQALSYEWGSAATPFRILVRDRKGRILGYIPLTSNLYNALKDLRDSPSIGSKRFWIDQISIHQNNITEKSHQVSFMKEIYRNATRVITYLGPHSVLMNKETPALELLDRIHKHLEPNYDLLAKATDIRHLVFDKSSLPVRSWPENIENDPAWYSLLRIVYGAWVRRLWMVQENSLCSNTIMLRGQREINWLSVASIPVLFYTRLLPDTILANSWYTLEMNSSQNAVFNQMYLTYVARCEHIYGNDSRFQASNLSMNLRFYEGMECRDPRDKIYALLSISIDADRLGIRPDYDISFEELLVDVSMRVYSTNRELSLIENSRRQRLEDDLGLPSWAYDGVKGSDASIPDHYPHPTYRADVRFESTRIMVVTGRIIDTIDDASPTLDDVEPGNVAGHRLFLERLLYTIYSDFAHRLIEEKVRDGLVFALMAEYPASVEEGKPIFSLWCLCRVIAKILLAEPPGYGSDKVEVDNLNGLRNLLRSFSLRFASFDFGPGRPTTRSFFGELTKEELALGNRVFSKLGIDGRSLAYSAKGRALNSTGLAVKGDVIAVLAGGWVTYVLRPVGDNFVYVGTVYSKDFANGALYEGLAPDQVDMEIRIA